MEQQLNNSISELPITEIHNYYEVTICNKMGEIVKKAYGFNKAYSDVYMKSKMIYILTLLGTQRSKEIEPFPENTDIDKTQYWERNENPTYLGNDYFAGYKAKVTFLEGYKGKITGIQMSGGNGVISQAALKDIEGHPIILEYEETENITVNAFIYFVTKVKYRDKGNYYYPIHYPIQYFQPDCSIYCGCCGHNIELLEIKDARYDHNGHLVNDGYLPAFVLKNLAFTKSPIPTLDSKGNLRGGINNYLELKPTIGKIYKNATPDNCWKGLITAIVLPGIGLIDLREAKGPLRAGIFTGSKVVGQTTCYIPQEYVVENDESLISMTKNAFYNAPHVLVRRYRPATAEKPEVNTEIPLHQAFFSDLVEDGRQRRCESFIQHIPLTDYYCGAETIIPCSPGKFLEDKFSWYGYQITYTGRIGANESYLTANYAVSGEVVTEVYDGYRNKITFPYKLEYSFDGNDFEVAAEFTESSKPYEPQYFETISAPIWRITSEIVGRTLSGPTTTHSDPYVSEAAGLNNSGYDPLFIFVGYNSSKDNRSFDDLDEEEIQKIQDSIDNTPDFNYENMGSGLGKVFHTKVPYLYHENDCFYFCGGFNTEEIVEG